MRKSIGERRTKPYRFLGPQARCCEGMMLGKLIFVHTLFRKRNNQRDILQSSAIQSFPCQKIREKILYYCC